MAGHPELPVLEPDSRERADAARNRDRILCTATRLFSERGAGCVSMDDVAEAAGVGKGTVFRRFGSRAALAAELFLHLHHAREMPLERLKAGWRELVRRAVQAADAY